MSAPVPQRKPPESKRHRSRRPIAINFGNYTSFPRRREPRTWRIMWYPRQTWKVRPYGLVWAARHFRRLRRWNGRGRPTCLPRCHKGNHLNRNATVRAGLSQSLWAPVVPAKAGTSHLASDMSTPAKPGKAGLTGWRGQRVISGDLDAGMVGADLCVCPGMTTKETTLIETVLAHGNRNQPWEMPRRSREGGNLALGRTLSRFR